MSPYRTPWGRVCCKLLSFFTLIGLYFISLSIRHETRAPTHLAPQQTPTTQAQTTEWVSQHFTMFQHETQPAVHITPVELLPGADLPPLPTSPMERIGQVGEEPLHGGEVEQAAIIQSYGQTETMEVQEEGDEETQEWELEQQQPGPSTSAIPAKSPARRKTTPIYIRTPTGKLVQLPGAHWAQAVGKIVAQTAPWPTAEEVANRTATVIQSDPLFGPIYQLPQKIEKTIQQQKVDTDKMGETFIQEVKREREIAARSDMTKNDKHYQLIDDLRAEVSNTVKHGFEATQAMIRQHMETLARSLGSRVTLPVYAYPAFRKAQPDTMLPIVHTEEVPAPAFVQEPIIVEGDTRSIGSLLASQMSAQPQTGLTEAELEALPPGTAAASTQIDFSTIRANDYVTPRQQVEWRIPPAPDAPGFPQGILPRYQVRSQ